MKDFKDSIRKKINVVEAKLEFLKDGQAQLAEAFHEFAEEIDEYIEHQADKNEEFDKRLRALENGRR